MVKPLSRAKSTPNYSVDFKPGDYIFREGEPGDSMFIVEDGIVEIVKVIRSEERQLTVLEQGDFFGEASILDDLPRGASAKAVTDCKLLQIDASTFDQMLRQNPEIAVRMLRKLSRRLRESSGLGAAQESDFSSVPVESTPTPAPPARAPLPVASASAPPGLTPVASRAPAAAPAGSVERVAVSSPAPADSPTASPSGGRLVADGTEFVLPVKTEATVGRFDPVTGIRPDVDLSTVDTSRSTSRRHAKIYRDAQRLFVYEEIGTANGTFVNGERIKTGMKTEFKDGDEVTFGKVKVVFRAS